MQLSLAAWPPHARSTAKAPPGRMMRSVCAFLGALLAVFALSAAPALADAGKVLVFTGTAGTPNAASADTVTAIKALGTANDFTVDNSADKADINAANLAKYRAVVFVHSSGDVLDAAGETALQDYVQGGGGFVGIGETALLEQGGAAFFNTLTGLTGRPHHGHRRLEHRRTSSSSTACTRRRARCRCSTRRRPRPGTRGPRTRPAPCTRSPASAATRCPDGTSVPNDAVSRFTGATATIQPQLERPASWCRDIQQGRSFYTELGSSAASLANADIKKHLLGAIQWASGMVRGGCKAGINSNYTATRLTPPNAAGTQHATSAR